MQASFSELEYAAKKKVTRRDRLLGEIEKVTPWSTLVAEIEPFYPKEERGRPPMGVERMLRMYIAQLCFGLSDEGIEDAIDDSQAIRRFVGIDLSRESAPDATTLPTFGRLLEEHKLTERIFTAINTMLAAKGLILKEGTVVDATIIAEPSSTKNRSGRRDPRMVSGDESQPRTTNKGNPGHFERECVPRFARPPQAASCNLRPGCMKAHIGIDAPSGMTYTRVTTPANVHDATQSNALLHGVKSRPWRCWLSGRVPSTPTARPEMGGIAEIRRATGRTPIENGCGTDVSCPPGREVFSAPLMAQLIVQAGR